MSNNKIREQVVENTRNKSNTFERIIPIILLVITLVSIVATIGILYTLISQSFEFFSRVPITEFLLSTTWQPYVGDGEWGIWALIMGTMKIVVIAAIVAIPIGLGAAIYLSEYASDKVRRLIKPILEVLAGIPTVVYGFFAINFVNPILQSIYDGFGLYNAVSAGLVVGVMIIPMIASLSEDAMSSVPASMREGSLGMGATRLETAVRVVIPAAFSGIIASFVLAISRAIGETMIVSIAAGSTPNASFDVTEPLQTMTGFIVQITSGDAAFGTNLYYSLFAVGMALFVMTLIMNIISSWLTNRFKEEY
ncbi:phosphate ABC transporter permease subunit PstC [Jeotgalicoccus huakuii]|uniref:phosphate ABC transporter permease subunit PstC n=1 Tax=Jeotgalicoccus TaxID=227979 RepID=UPI0003FAEC92|nr:MULTISPECIES: phosphate ABC transporter permease subunit PstC [Jeotgalicoccus]MCK1977108.1 phosphate ABC transporter permease subunit PstC [Jeotgalicoccus huakuii]QQD85487.1 phosphate ABC transporter permease subunit PstC [Jeotgalicoccus sp. ATCC 8456]